MVLTDGRGKCLESMLSSLVNVWAPFENRIIVNDSGDRDYARWLDRLLPDCQRIHHRRRRGFCGAIQSGWSAIPKDVDFVFHVEDDFVFIREINLWHLAMVLERNAHVVQMALQRQPVAAEEIAAGGVVQVWPDQYEQKHDSGVSWLEHRLFFTTNPSLYRRSLVERGWPDGPRCEEEFGRRLLADSDLRFGYWGERDDGPWVEHVGGQRVGMGY